jgi:hypothetical protein
MKNERDLFINLIPIIALIAGLAIAPPARAQYAGQEIFKTPQDAADALFLAAKNHDKVAALHVLGAKAEDLFNTGDVQADVSQHQLFVEKYQQMHRLVSVGKHTEILYVGAENWPLPVPIKKGNSGWFFDTKGARAEILARRIGANELSAINTCLAIVQAQNEYKAQSHEYAQRLSSTDGKHDGLYWSTEGSEPKSPVGPRLAMASYQGGGSASPESKPYYGYYYKILTAQGSKAPGGAIDYLDNGKMTKGFALVAYPAKYRVSGVTTFIVNQDGVVLQKDLGPDTEKLATSMEQFDPDTSWVSAN